MFMCLFVHPILDAAVAVNVAGVLFDGPLGDKGRVLCVARYLHGPTCPLSCEVGRRKEREGGENERDIQPEMVEKLWTTPFKIK